MRKTALCSLVLLATLSACGGGSDDTASTNSSSSSSSGSGTSASSSTSITATQASSICSGNSSSQTFYDVYFPSEYGIAQRSVRMVKSYGGASDAQQCLAMEGTTADANKLNIVTTDAWNNAIGYFEYVVNGLGNVTATNPVSGALRLNQQLFIACSTSSDAIKYLGVKSSATVSTEIFGTKDAASVLRNTGFTSLECKSNGAGAYQVGNGSAVATFATDGSLSVTESGSTTLSISAANVPALFSYLGYTVNGTTFRWTLYQVSVGSSSKQLIVHTAKKADGTYGVLAFMQP